MAMPLTNEEKATAVRLHQAGRAPTAIAAELNRKERTIIEYLASVGRVEPPLPSGLTSGQITDIVAAYVNGQSIKQLAAEHGLPYARVRAALLYAGVPLRSRGGRHGR